MKVILHAHSDWSYDGSWTLSDISRLYATLGADAVMMTEHDTGFDPSSFEAYRRACKEASNEKCTLIPGIEYSSPDNDIHILTWGLPHFLAEHRPVLETLEAVAEARGAAIFAHPIRRAAWRKFESKWVPLLSGIELWNRKSDGISAGFEAANLIAQTGLPATVGQDFHKARHLYPLWMSATVAGEDIETELVTDLRKGAMTPMAFGQPVLGPDGRPSVFWHDRAEAIRRSLRNMRNKLKHLAK